MTIFHPDFFFVWKNDGPNRDSPWFYDTLNDYATVMISISIYFGHVI